MFYHWGCRIAAFAKRLVVSVRIKYVFYCKQILFFNDRHATKPHEPVHKESRFFRITGVKWWPLFSRSNNSSSIGWVLSAVWLGIGQNLSALSPDPEIVDVQHQVDGADRYWHAVYWYSVHIVRIYHCIHGSPYFAALTNPSSFVLNMFMPILSSRVSPMNYTLNPAFLSNTLLPLSISSCFLSIRVYH